MYSFQNEKSLRFLILGITALAALAAPPPLVSLNTPPPLTPRSISCQPQTPNPKPKTPNPKSKTPNPKPQTLRPNAVTPPPSRSPPLPPSLSRFGARGPFFEDRLLFPIHEGKQWKYQPSLCRPLRNAWGMPALFLKIIHQLTPQKRPLSYVAISSPPKYQHFRANVTVLWDRRLYQTLAESWDVLGSLGLPLQPLLS